jgi:energy-coupling factor transport system ATP-binding protein
VIILENNSFKYAETEQGVRNIDLTIRPGECVVLVGRSGNGKTTLTRLLNGLAPNYYPGDFSGHILMDGQDVTASPLWQRGKTVGSVFQNPKSQFFSAELAGEIAFACENYGHTQADIRRRTDSAISVFGLDALRGRSIDLFSSGEKQRAAIASVYTLRPKVYVCDEPTANLDETGVRQLAKTLARLKNDGASLLIAEHRLAWLQDIANHFIYLEDGRVVWQRTPRQMADMDEDERERYGLRAFVPVTRPLLPQPSGKQTPVISAQRLLYKRRKTVIWQDVDFSAWPRQVIAIVGENGIGKTTLAKVLSGLARQSAGQVSVGGKALSPTARRKHVWYSDNDTGAQFFTNSVGEELLLCSDRSEQTLDKARSLLRVLELYEYRDVHPASLSGGQKQRLSIACGLLSGREVLIFDEPTSGLDGKSLQIVGELLRQAAESGTCVLVITHDNELIRKCCTHLYAMR